MNKPAGLLRQSAAYTLASFAGPLIGIFMVPIYTRILAPEDYGVLDLVNVTISFVAAILTLGIDNATGRYYMDPSSDQDRTVTASTALLFGVVVTGSAAILGILFAGPIARVMFPAMGAAVYLMLAFAALPLNRTFSLCSSLLRYNFRSATYVGVSVMQMGVGTSLTILLVVLLKWGLTGVFVAPLLATGLFLAVLIVFTKRYFSLTFSAGRLKQLLVYGIPLVPYGFTVYVLQYLDRYFLAHYCSLEDVGVYGIGVRISSLISFVFIGSGAAFSPFLMSSYQDESTRVIYRRVVDYSVAATAFVVVGVSIFSKEILAIFTTSAYGEAHTVVPLLAGYTALYYLGLRMSEGIHIAKKTVYLTIVSVVVALLNLGLNFLLIPSQGIVGAALATFLSAVAWCIALVWVSQRLYYVKYSYRAYAGMGVLAAALIVPVNVLLPLMSWQTILVKMGCMMVCVCGMYAFGLVTREDLARVASFAVRLVRRDPLQ